MPHPLPDRAPVPQALTLAPCPFCGNPEVSLSVQADVYVGCDACGMRGPLSTTAEEALWLWQTRVPVEPVDVE